MAMDWNDKLAFLLHGFPDQVLGASHLAPSLNAMLQGGSAIAAPDQAAPPPAPLAVALGWLATAADRAPVPAGDRAPHVDFAHSPEWTHPISLFRAKLDPISADRCDDVIRRVIDEVLSRYPGDPRRQYLWFWRHLPSALASADKALGAVWMRMPAEATSPDHSIWHRMSLAACLASSVPDPAFLVIALEPSHELLGHRCTAADLRAALAIRSWTSWSAACALVAELGPDAILYPDLRLQPLFDRWLRSEGVEQATDVTALSNTCDSTFPDKVLALVPASRAEELGNRAAAAARDAWNRLGSCVRDQLSTQLGISDAVWGSIWDRHLQLPFDLGWTSVPLEDDSTGAGALLASRDIAAFDKALKQRREATGVERGGKGLFFGIWQDAARAAADCRRHSLSLPLSEPGPRCSICARREALHADGVLADGVAKLAADKAPAFSAQLGQGDGVCGVCAVQRLGPTLAAGGGPQWRQGSSISDSKPYSVVMLNGDNVAGIFRGGLENKESATLRSVLHSEMAQQLTSLRLRWKDVLDTPVLSGPSRTACISEALGEYALRSVPEIVTQGGGELLWAAGDEVVAITTSQLGIEVAHRLRDRYREPHVPAALCGGKGTYSALHLGPVATTSGVVALAQAGEPIAHVVQSCRELLDTLGKDTLGRDSLVVFSRGGSGRDLVFGCRWGELGDSFEVAAKTLSAVADRAALLGKLRELAVAITAPELDKTRTESRAALVRLALVSSAVEPQELDRASRAFLTLMDRNGAPAQDGDGSRALDGIQLARLLVEGLR
jgi:hypothetical protein